MRFNKFIFNCYLESDHGKEANSFFNKFPNLIKNGNKNELINFINSQYLKPQDEEDINSRLNELKETIIDIETGRENNSVNTLEEAEIFYKNFIQILLNNDERENITYRELLPDIQWISIILHLFFPEYFFPYFFTSHFYKLEKIFNEFNIVIPPPPSKRKYREKIDYYFELCKCLYDFRTQLMLTSNELNIFLYFFAPQIIDNITLTNELPSPSKVYISGATNEDSVWISSVNENDICIWAGNLNTLPGDIILIYEVSPYSLIKSIWRALTPGFYDPFDYWSDEIWVGKPIMIPDITFSELRENNIWKNKGLVKAHMQGVSGRACSKEEYEAIKTILKKKGFNISLLPDLEYSGLDTDVEINIEKDVEEKLLEPLLKKLNFLSNDWIKQMPVRMGRGERIYPDYVIYPKTKKGEESGFFIWEAKYSIKNKNELLDAFYQSKSYALRLNTNGLGLVSLEGIWISLKSDNFLFKKIIHFTWKELNNPDNFNKVKLFIGNNKH